jgi:hypothetical protein
MNNTERLYLVKQAGLWSELGGGITSTLGGGLAGAGVGGTIGGIGGLIGEIYNRVKHGDDIDFGNTADMAAAGAGAGATVGGYGSYLANTLGGPLAALATKTRNFDEQKESEKELLKNLLIPGRSSYNMYKRLGHSVRGEGSPGEAAEKEETEAKLKKLDKKDKRD